MKTKVMMLAFLMMMGDGSLMAKDKSESFEVKGNCSMCENRIEKAALSVEGVESADWSSKTKMIELVYDESKTDSHKIQMAIATVGHDTPMHKADDEVYNALPSCCLYDRDEDESMEMDHQH